MHYQFKQAAHIGGKDYPRGVHQVPEDHEYDPMFLKFVEKGLIVDVEQTRVISPKTVQERSKKLHDKLIAKKATKTVKTETTEPPPVDPVKTTETKTAELDAQAQVEADEKAKKEAETDEAKKKAEAAKAEADAKAKAKPHHKK